MAHLGGVEATIEGLEHGVGFTLFLTDGWLDNLEGYTYDEPWPDTIETFSLRYWRQPRDLTGLGSLAWPDASGDRSADGGT